LNDLAGERKRSTMFTSAPSECNARSASSWLLRAALSIIVHHCRARSPRFKPVQVLQCRMANATRCPHGRTDRRQVRAQHPDPTPAKLGQRLINRMLTSTLRSLLDETLSRILRAVGQALKSSVGMGAFKAASQASLAIGTSSRGRCSCTAVGVGWIQGSSGVRRWVPWICWWAPSLL
jgi:hypothetical protein